MNKLLDQWFPNHIIPATDGMSFQDFIESDLEELVIQRQHVARKMITQIYQYTYKKDGSFKKETVYDVYPKEVPDKRSCLNVFGSRMIIEYLTNHQIGPSRPQLIPMNNPDLIEDKQKLNDQQDQEELKSIEKKEEINGYNNSCFQQS